jgi:hypothetical protein
MLLWRGGGAKAVKHPHRFFGWQAAAPKRQTGSFATFVKSVPAHLVQHGQLRPGITGFYDCQRRIELFAPIRVAQLLKNFRQGGGHQPCPVAGDVFFSICPFGLIASFFLNFTSSQRSVNDFHTSIGASKYLSNGCFNFCLLICRVSFYNDI